MKLSKFRSNLYKLARWLGDLNAVAKGRIGARVWSRITGKMAGRGLRKIQPDPRKRK